VIIDISCYPTQVVDLAWQHDGEPFTGERLLAMMDGPYFVNGKPRRIDKRLHPAAAGQHDLHLDRRRDDGRSPSTPTWPTR
jgi:predicted TIM-barrel fold metal-dependent hydrolase